MGKKFNIMNTFTVLQRQHTNTMPHSCHDGNIFASDPKPRQMGTVYILGLRWLGEGLLIAYLFQTPNPDRWVRYTS